MFQLNFKRVLHGLGINVSAIEKRQNQPRISIELSVFGPAAPRISGRFMLTDEQVVNTVSTNSDSSNNGPTGNGPRSNEVQQDDHPTASFATDITAETPEQRCIRAYFVLLRRINRCVDELRVGTTDERILYFLSLLFVVEKQFSDYGYRTILPSALAAANGSTDADLLQLRHEAEVRIYYAAIWRRRIEKMLIATETSKARP